MLFKKYFKHFRLPERSNKGQGSNPHNIFPSFFSGNKIWWRGKIIWNFLKAIWHFPYPPIVIVLGWFLVDSMAFFTTWNRNQKRGTEICWWDNSSAMPWIQHDPTLEGLGSDFLPVYWFFSEVILGGNNFVGIPASWVNRWDFWVPKPWTKQLSRYCFLPQDSCMSAEIRCFDWFWDVEAPCLKNATCSTYRDEK